MSRHITLTTDAGTESVYVPAFKGILYSALNDLIITEISSSIAMRNIQQAAFFLQHTYSYYPENTLHIIDVDSSFVLHKRLIYTRYEKHHFLALDNGVLSLVLPDIETQAFAAKLDGMENKSRYEKFAFAAKHILENTRSAENFSPITSHKTYKQQVPNIMGNRITAQILTIDKYGNCITNLSMQELENHRKGRKVMVRLPFGEVIENLNESYYEVDDGDVVCIRNNMGLLEIAIHNANASTLLGLHEKSPVIFEFE